MDSLVFPFLFSAHVHYISILIMGVEKERRIKNGPWSNLKRKHPLLELP